MGDLSMVDLTINLTNLTSLVLGVIPHLNQSLMRANVPRRFQPSINLTNLVP